MARDWQELTKLVGEAPLEIERVRLVETGVAIEGPFTLPRDAEGRIDVPQSTQLIATVIERWIREHPEQWLWFHRRWR